MEALAVAGVVAVAVVVVISFSVCVALFREIPATSRVIVLRGFYTLLAILSIIYLGDRAARTIIALWLG